MDSPVDSFIPDPPHEVSSEQSVHFACSRRVIMAMYVLVKCCCTVRSARSCDVGCCIETIGPGEFADAPD